MTGAEIIGECGHALGRLGMCPDLPLLWCPECLDYMPPRRDEMERRAHP